MSQLPDAFKGHALTGWTVAPVRGDWVAARLSLGGMVVFAPLDDGKWTYSHPGFNRECLSVDECLRRAVEFAEFYGGWAPAPIGYVLESEAKQ